MRVDLLSIFPDMFAPVLEHSIIGRARQHGLLDLRCTDLRLFTDDRHRTVDDSPYGGGAGMVLKVEPVVQAIEAVVGDEGGPPQGRCIALMSAAGEVFDQRLARELAPLRHLVLVAGRYEGVDERVAAYVDRELSIGDFVLTGGELAAMVVVDAVGRLLPGVLGNAGSLDEESHDRGRLEHPHYTRPVDFAGLTVPEVLRSGNHAHIKDWRLRQSIERTRQRRPDLLDRQPLRPDELRSLYEKPRRRREPR